MSDLRVLVLRAAGINCDEEVMHCWQLAGATPTLMHVNELAKTPSVIDDFTIVTIPGGFSYGDDLGAGVILARRLMQDVALPLRQLVERGGGILGICNGFQVLVKMGLLPGQDFGNDQVTVTYNNSSKFEARWVKLKVCTDICPFLNPNRAEGFSPRGLEIVNDSRNDAFLELPIEHAEGKVVTANEEVVAKLEKAGQIAVRYIDNEGRTDTYPANPNGSTSGIAGLCDATGRVFGLMPHPDRHFDNAHHPQWTKRDPAITPDGLTIFNNAVRFWKK
ncbi:phosphoribosylformylglycinamidine synthase I [bacterium AH-315-J04]|nr:phosphoribosylformylglycinamidine synthase I [bacterium AH-315-J04]